MKRMIAVMLAVFMLASVLTMAVSAKGSDDLLETIQKRGTIIVGLEGDWAPWSYVDENDELTGYDVEVAKAIADKLGVEIQIVPGEWDGLFAGMDAGRYDMVVNGVEVTEERADKYDFSTPYAYIRTALIVKGDNDSIKTFEDLKSKKTANSIASTYMNLAESYGATCYGVSTLDETLTMVLQGRVDATLNAIVSFTDYMAQHPDSNLKVVATTEEASNVAIPMRKGDETASLREAVNKAIDELREDGTLSELSTRFFGEDISK
jgi:amino acid ABC transporter, periplasmic amino acid-binding protein